MKATLTLNYDTDDRDECKAIASIAAKDHENWQHAIFEYDQELRKQVKYASDEDNADFIDGVEKARTDLWKILNDFDLELI